MRTAVTEEAVTSAFLRVRFKFAHSRCSKLISLSLFTLLELINQNLFDVNNPVSTAGTQFQTLFNLLHQHENRNENRASLFAVAGEETMRDGVRLHHRIILNRRRRTPTLLRDGRLRATS